MRFSTSRPGKTNKYFGTKLGRRDFIGKIYKLTKFGEDRLWDSASTWWWNITTLKRQDTPIKVTILIDNFQTKNSFLVLVVQREVYFTRWRLPPSWVFKNCRHFFSIYPIVTNISGNIGTSIWNMSMTSEKQGFENSRCNFITYWSIIIKFSRNIATLM